MNLFCSVKLLFTLLYFLELIQGRHIRHVDHKKYSKNGNTCGYDSCPPLLLSTDKSEVLNVHIIAHSHDDTGWLKTVDQYYLGSNRARFSGNEENQRVGVQYILDTVVKELMFDPNRK